jgi:serine/threonine protein kinase
VATWAQGQQIGPYTLRRRLGEGAMAEVWLASGTGMGGIRRNVALKLVKGEPEQKTYDSVVREAQICARLQHPNIVDVLGVEIHEGTLLLSMQYVAGGTLRQLVRRVKRAGLGFPQSVVVDLLVDILRGLARAHGEEGMKRPQVLHRDLKPENVLLDVTGRAVLADFGFAKLIGETSKTTLGRIKGTQRYVAPEIWKDTHGFHPRCDLFAVGCMLFELVTLRRLMDGDFNAIIHAIVERTAAEEAAMVAEVAPRLAGVTQLLLERDPEKRYQSARQVIDDLKPQRHRRGAPADVAEFLTALTALEQGRGRDIPSLQDRLSKSKDRRWAALGRRLGEQP